ncbi:MAG: ABC transporter permease [Sarcina sp.]
MKNIMIAIKKDKGALISLIFLIIFGLACIFAFLSPYKPNGINLANSFDPPSIHHIFGTDSLGRDYFTRILYGGRITLLVGLSVMIISTFIGAIIGALSGYIGGVFDTVVMRVLEILMSIPAFFILLVLSVILKSSLIEIVLVLAAFSWMGTARIIRGEVNALREVDYIKCAKTQGIGTFKIIKTHVIPNISQIIIVNATMTAAGAILTEAMLSFLGLGLKPPVASLGSMLNAGQQNMMTEPYLVVFPSIAIILVILAFNMIGRGLQKSIGKRR